MNVLKRTAALSGASVALIALTPSHYLPNEISIRKEAAIRFTRTAFYGSLVLIDYAGLDHTEKFYGKLDDRSQEHRAKVERRSAQRLLHVIMEHGGLYTKLGQYLASLTHVLPLAYTEVLSIVQDRASHETWENIKPLFEQEKLDISSVFEFINPVPIASASLAQVHYGQLKNGEEVAIKMQYPRLETNVNNDFGTIRLCLQIIEALYPDWGYTWLLPEFYASVLSELDFRQEYRNAYRVINMFKSSNLPIYVPRVYDEFSSKRILVMEFIHGTKVNNKASLEKMGIDPRLVANTVVEFQASQVSMHGFIHADLHAGNIMVRQAPTAKSKGFWSFLFPNSSPKFQVVVLDHGMYRRIQPIFRRLYCQLWCSLVYNDRKLGLETIRELGLAPAAYDVLSVILVNRTSTSNSKLGAKMSKDEIHEIRTKFGSKSNITPKQINDFLQTLPRDLLFILRTSNMVRAIHTQLDGAAVDRFEISGRAAVKGLQLSTKMSAAKWIPQRPLDSSTEKGDGKTYTAVDKAMRVARVLLFSIPIASTGLDELNAPTESEVESKIPETASRKLAAFMQYAYFRARLWVIGHVLFARYVDKLDPT
jgi:aarF domain-containing kinase